MSPAITPFSVMPDYEYKGSGTNSQVGRQQLNSLFPATDGLQGSHWCARDHGSGAANSNSYHYSNHYAHSTCHPTDGSYYYSNPNGSSYYNNGSGSSTYTAPNGSSYKSSGGSSGGGK
ncbi:hypothetical protein HJFPF1_03697 [Paramyrothecium foliicola]|nr:hypothetical protein HJFPF1_03697 [Paramyrothecium foliicola]